MKEFISTSLIILYVVLYLLGSIWNSIDIVVNSVDTFQNGLIQLREGYIPPSKRKVDGVKFVPDGEDPRDYIKE